MYLQPACWHLGCYSIQMALSLTIPGLACSLQPLCEVADKVKEEITLRYTDHFVADFNKQGEPLRAAQAQTLSYAGTEVLGACA